MSRASVVVDVQTIRLVVDDVGICSQSIKHRLGNVPAGAVGTVQTDLDPLKGVDTEADQIAHVAVATGNVVHRAANMLTASKGQLRPVLVEQMELSVDVVIYQQQGLLGHLLTVAVDQLDTVIIVRVVAGGDHDTTIKVIHASNVSHGRRSSNVQQVGICAGSGQTRNQTVLEHIGSATSVLTNDYTGRVGVSITLTEHIVIPSQETTYFICVVGRQGHASIATEAIVSKILSHYSFFLI